MACSSSPRPAGDDGPSLPPAHESTPPPSTPVADRSCGTLPQSSGPLTGLARVEVDAPAVARPGSRIAVRATISFSSSTARTISVPSRSELLLLDGDRVVARGSGASSAADIPLIATVGASRPAQAVPSSIDLTVCGEDEGGAPVPAGRYRLAAVLRYRLDSLNSGVDGPSRPAPTGQDFALVSEPVPIRVE